MASGIEPHLAMHTAGGSSVRGLIGGMAIIEGVTDRIDAHPEIIREASAANAIARILDHPYLCGDCLGRCRKTYLRIALCRSRGNGAFALSFKFLTVCVSSPDRQIALIGKARFSGLGYCCVTLSPSCPETEEVRRSQYADN